ncbi:hypothetical protein CLF_105247 [Clonorchis sinensis]|uniref:Uncharacterized protein n=1 Tax=Clonorchis sinensis TaxID=79923 RepID=G7YP51_CLOSI|nr:hypothetical protein CLF_105247 [Clonorchis sinensis]
MMVCIIIYGRTSVSNTDASLRTTTVVFEVKQFRLTTVVKTCNHPQLLAISGHNPIAAKNHHGPSMDSRLSTDSCTTSRCQNRDRHTLSDGLPTVQIFLRRACYMRPKGHVTLLNLCDNSEVLASLLYCLIALPTNRPQFCMVTMKPSETSLSVWALPKANNLNWVVLKISHRILAVQFSLCLQLTDARCRFLRIFVDRACADGVPNGVLSTGGVTNASTAKIQDASSTGLAARECANSTLDAEAPTGYINQHSASNTITRKHARKCALPITGKDCKTAVLIGRATNITHFVDTFDVSLKRQVGHRLREGSLKKILTTSASRLRLETEAIGMSLEQDITSSHCMVECLMPKKDSQIHNSYIPNKRVREHTSSPSTTGIQREINGPTLPDTGADDLYPAVFNGEEFLLNRLTFILQKILNGNCLEVNGVYSKQTRIIADGEYNTTRWIVRTRVEECKMSLGDWKVKPIQSKRIRNELIGKRVLVAALDTSNKECFQHCELSSLGHMSHMLSYRQLYKEGAIEESRKGAKRHPSDSNRHHAITYAGAYLTDPRKHGSRSETSKLAFTDSRIDTQDRGFRPSFPGRFCSCRSAAVVHLKGTIEKDVALLFKFSARGLA